MLNLTPSKQLPIYGSSLSHLQRESSTAYRLRKVESAFTCNVILERPSTINATPSLLTPVCTYEMMPMLAPVLPQKCRIDSIYSTLLVPRMY
ncbi:hypothetical protein MPTK1_7g12960 [Marchantia polymorpha subsp. ruderalis]|uniref:Uncharacterized protein n=2 Tax=Marchantia polymorpha TaxID=3197 RepID=A0AAF6BYZ8_MARPO|nr:hypothetical protein MARPO_0003s0304 [Marchantia polymorpha]BBN17232.1 hypothetical protein Mp_7g12960 [Marchantia polymorpha subsp. ruderalis]|eukprot:PTQ49467.1 hypothetical protein MARPO_0003s0304 [Marchantia polymorpha]